MPTKCCWVIHGRLTSERKASLPDRHSSPLDPAARALKRQAPCLTCTRALDRLSMRRRVGSTYRRGNHMHDHSAISAWYRMTSQASLSLSLSLSLLLLTKVTDAQYRKRFRPSYNRRKCCKFHPADVVLFVIVFVLSACAPRNRNSMCVNTPHPHVRNLPIAEPLQY